MIPRKVSVIVRFNNEARYLEAVLQAIRSQRHPATVEIVAVDNASNDGSRAIAERYADVLADETEYRPGKALNRSIDLASGDTIVVLSAHAIPANDSWLAQLTKEVQHPEALASYGAQIYPLTDRFLDKRDLDIFSDPAPRIEKYDSDLWNANSAFARVRWETIPFDESVIELEDHYWTKVHLPQSNCHVRYEPAAQVYHYGHADRNDRQFLEPSLLTRQEQIASAIAQLDAKGGGSWPEVMRAGMTLGSLWDEPGIEAAIPAMGRMLLEHWDFDVRWRMAGALGRIRSGEAVPFLVRGLEDPSFYARDEAAWSLGRLGSLSVGALSKAVHNMRTRSLPFAALALGLSGDSLGGQMTIEVLARCVASADIHTERDAIYFLGEVAERVEVPSDLVASVSARLASGNRQTARAAVWCLGMLAAAGNSAAREHLPAVVEVAQYHQEPTIRAEALVCLGRYNAVRYDENVFKVLCQSLHVEVAGRVRYAAMQHLRLAAHGGVQQARTAALRHFDDSDFGVLFERDLATGPVRGR